VSTRLAYHLSSGLTTLSRLQSTRSKNLNLFQGTDSGVLLKVLQ